MNLIWIIVIGIVGLLFGGVIGFVIFRYVTNGEYKEKMKAAEHDAQVLKEKKKLKALAEDTAE